MKAKSPPRARPVAVAGREPLIGSDRYDYADAFEIRLPEPDDRSVEQFVRTAVEEAPAPLLLTVRLAHKYLLRLRLGPRSSPDHVFGFKILKSERDLIHLEALSPVLGRAVIVGRRIDATRAVLTTYLFFARPTAALVVWKIAGPLHRKVAPYLMEHVAANTSRLVEERTARR